MKHPTLFDNPPEPDANDPYRSPEPPQVQARRDGLRMAEPKQSDHESGCVSALWGAPDGLTRVEILAYINARRPSNPIEEQSLVNNKRIGVLPERRLGSKGVKVTVYMHARFKSD